MFSCYVSMFLLLLLSVCAPHTYAENTFSLILHLGRLYFQEFHLNESVSKFCAYSLRPLSNRSHGSLMDQICKYA